jgi:hypothetical protein
VDRRDVLVSLEKRADDYMLACNGSSVGMRPHLVALLREVAAAERERCAKECVTVADEYVAAGARRRVKLSAIECRDRIRAMGDSDEEDNT